MKKINLALIILDGLGKGENNLSNPFRLVKNNFFEELKKTFPFTYLQASGFSVGLSSNEPGNCEQGHLTLGTGRIKYVPKARIDLAIEKNELLENKTIKQIVDFYYTNSSRIHLLMTLSKVSQESDVNHLIEFLKIFKNYKCERVFLHFFTDSSFSPPKSLKELINNFLNIKNEMNLPGKIASLCGRFYALDTTKNYSIKTQRAFLLLVEGKGKKVDDLFSFLESKMNEPNFKEDNLEPVIIDENGIIKDNDIVVFLNFEIQTIKQLAEAFFLSDFKEFSRPAKENLLLISLVNYFENLPTTSIFTEEKINLNLSRIISEVGLRQFKITDQTRKKHLTYYFNGFIEEEHVNEIIKILPPIENEETAYSITEELITYLKLIFREKNFHFVCANFSILDFFGHLGDFNKAVQAIEFLSEKLKELVELALKENWFLILTSDHGNIEKMIDLTKGTKDTFHNFSPVPFYLIHQKLLIQKEKIIEEIGGSLVDVTPTILDLFGILSEYSNYLEGNSLLSKLK